VASPGRSADIKKVGWRFHVPVCFGIVGGALLIAVTEILSSAHRISGDLRDAGLVVGGILIGLIALSLNEFYRTAPQRARVEREREAERQRHQEERRLDFEQYRALQSELRETRSRASTLQGKLELTGALDRDRVGDALLLGFYFHRRGEGLPSSPRQSIFKTAALRLKLTTEKTAEVKLDKNALHDVLEIAYGPVVAEAFDLGYLLSHLGEDGFPQTHSAEILGELEKQLKALKLDSKVPAGADLPEDASGLFKKLAARVISIVRRM
jgi:hypothetical protein